MPAQPRTLPVRESVDTLPPDARQCLAILRDAYCCAVRLGLSDWEFAIDVGTLMRQGIGPTALRLLRAAGFVKCRLECLTPNATQRAFRPLDNLALPDNACLVITPAGLEHAPEPESLAALSARNGFADTAAAPTMTHTPLWDYKQTLWWGNQVIKRLRGHALRQRLVLAALQEARWPQRIDSPLPPGKECLRQTVRHLNEHHQCRAIHFWVDEDTQSICWEPL
jgi:hypothetical protein